MMMLSSTSLTAPAAAPLGKRWRAGFAAVAIAVLVSGCANNGAVSNQTIGSVVGAGAGVAIGSAIGAGGGRTAAMIVGGVLGALVGSEIGRGLDERDRLLAQQTTYDVLENYPAGQAVSWNNPNTGYSGSTLASSPYYGADNRVCRRYEQSIAIEGRLETATGVACRNPDGSWQLVS